MRSRCRRVTGFTLVELIMVMLLLGVLAAFAAPKIFNVDDFNARGFHDETLGFLRYAQKAAVAQRRTVCVTFTASPRAYAVMSMASSAGALPSATACDKSLKGPNQQTPIDTSSNQFCGEVAITFSGPAETRGCIVAPKGVSYTTVPAELRFDGLGQPQVVDSTGGVVSPLPVPLIQVVNANRAIQVEIVTGLVHDTP